MKINEIRIHPSGVLQGACVTGLSPGLNVVLAPDGTGREVVQFVRQLLSPPGPCRSASLASADRPGSVTLESSAASFGIVRIPRAGHPTTEAIISRECEFHATETLRMRLAAADGCVIEQLCLVSAGDRERVSELRALARRLVTESASRGAIAAPAMRPDQETVVSLAQQFEQQRLEIAAQARTETRRQRELVARFRALDDVQRLIERDVEWLEAESQAADSDLREVENQLWCPPACVTPTDQPVSRQLSEPMGTYVEHVQRVICDLAERRMQLSRTLASSMAGAAVQVVTGPAGGRSNAIQIENERSRIDRCESELLHQLRCLKDSCGAIPRPENREVDASLPARPATNEAALRRRREDLLTHSRELQSRLDQARRRQCAVYVERTRLDAMRRRIVADDTLDARLYECSVLQEQLAAAQIEQQAVLVLNSIGRQPVSSPQSVESLRRRELAVLGRLTGSDPPDPGDAPDVAPVSAAHGTSEDDCESAPAALALRLALLSTVIDGRIEHPVVWDEALTDVEPERLRAAGRLLAELAVGGRQVILLTHRADVAAILAECGATTAPLSLTGPADIASASPAALGEDPPGPEPAAGPLVRIHPATPLWLRVDSPLHELPSLGPQTARQLRRVGLDDVGDLIALDLSNCTFLLSESRLTADQVRLWQAEAELLCCVPDLTGRDAQLLVGCGVLAPAELASAKPDQLVARIDRLRGGETTRWLPYVGVWPRAETVRTWIHAARRAESLESVFAAAVRAGRRARRWPSPFEREALRVAGRLTGGDSSAESSGRPDLRLRRDCAVVEAPAIGPKTARLLERLGIMTIGDLLACDPEATARRLRHPRITADVLVTWQRQTGFMCSIPGLRSGDALVLAACGMHEAGDLRRISASALWALVEPFVKSSEGRRLLRSAPPPTAEDVARWVQAAQDETVSRAA